MESTERKATFVFNDESFDATVECTTIDALNVIDYLVKALKEQGVGFDEVFDIIKTAQTQTEENNQEDDSVPEA